VSVSSGSGHIAVTQSSRAGESKTPSSVGRAVLDSWFIAAGRQVHGVSKADTQMLQHLLEEHKGKLDVNACDPADIGDRTALGHAASSGHAAAATLLLRWGADINKYCKNPAARPLLWAACTLQASAVAASLDPLCPSGSFVLQTAATSTWCAC
jgi:hypothetical protein